MKLTGKILTILLIILVFVSGSWLQANEGAGHDPCPLCSLEVLPSCCDDNMSAVGEPCHTGHEPQQPDKRLCCVGEMCPDLYQKLETVITKSPLSVLVPNIQPAFYSVVLYKPPKDFSDGQPLPYRPVELHIRNCAFLI